MKYVFKYIFTVLIADEGGIEKIDSTEKVYSLNQFNTDLILDLIKVLF